MDLIPVMWFTAELNSNQNFKEPFNSCSMRNTGNGDVLINNIALPAMSERRFPGNVGEYNTTNFVISFATQTIPSLTIVWNEYTQKDNTR